MQASPSDIAALLEIQQLDMEIMKFTKEYEELPQKQIIHDAGKKREVFCEKKAQVDALKKDASKRLSRINDEEESLEKKEVGVQAAIEAAGEDFRHAEARSKELEGISKRLEDLAEQKQAIDAELEKIGALQNQLVKAVKELDATIAQAEKTYLEKGAELSVKLDMLNVRREKIFDGIDDQVTKTYKKTAQKRGSVVIGKLEENKCSICRSSFDGGRLIDLKAQAPLGSCPSCQRLLIIG